MATQLADAFPFEGNIFMRANSSLVPRPPVFVLQFVFTIRPFQLVFLFLVFLGIDAVGGDLATLKPITSTQNTTVHQRNTQQPSEIPTKRYKKNNKTY